MTQRKLTVFIYLPGETRAVPAGIFTHDGDAGIGFFAYGRKYIERQGALPVDPVALPLGPAPLEVMTNGGLYGAFRDAAPDYWGRLVIAAEVGIPPEAFSETDFLIAANATRVGNLDFRSSPEDPEPQLTPPHFNELAEVIGAAEQIEAGEEPANHLLRLLRQGTSMGGARPKCTVEWEDELWIAKFPSQGDTLDIPRIEYATMTLAARTSIRVPDVRIISVGGKNIYLARRFDRNSTGNGWVRKGFISSLSLMRWDERENARWDYSSMADVMRRYMGQEFIEELYRRMIFNILVRNTDDHPRNHGFLVEKEGKLCFSPAYDIVPAPAMAGVGTDFRLAMTIGDQGREATLKNVLTRAPRFGLSSKGAQRIVEEMREIVGNWREHFEGNGVSGREIDLLSPSFARCRPDTAA